MNTSAVIRPAIRLNYSRRLADTEVLRQILYGAEEEGVPVETEVQETDDAGTLAVDAATASVLETGIGVSSGEAALQFRKLPPERPLSRIPLNAGETRLREIGANAARLVKKMPLKGFSPGEGGGGR